MESELSWSMAKAEAEAKEAATERRSASDFMVVVPRAWTEA
jgi:hypothetical protein